MQERVVPPFRADQVGSLIRPQNLIEAQQAFAKGEMPRSAMKEIQRREIANVVRMQEEIGLKSVTDGEFNRQGWQRDFLLSFDNVKLIESRVPVTFHSDTGTTTHAPPSMGVVGKLGRPREIFVDDYRYLHSIAKATPKVTIPSPTVLHFRGGREVIDRNAYPDLEEFYADLARVYREEIADLAAAGCRYLQVDEVNLAYLCDPALRAHVATIGEDPDTLLHTYAQLLNRLTEGSPEDMTFCMHLCRGNFGGKWVAEGGYDPVAEVLFNDIKFTGYFMEYDSDRAGGFEVLRHVPKGKTVVLGLVTTKRSDLESKDMLKRRIEEASKYCDIDQLALSPQCGFSSGVGGETMTIEQQMEKLRLVVEVATEVWGSA